MAWTEERVERLKAMWGDGLTATQIARELGGVSRNAVIGKVYRLGLSNRSSSQKSGEAAATGQAAYASPRRREAETVDCAQAASREAVLRKPARCEAEAVFVDEKQKSRGSAAKPQGRRKAAAETVTGATKKSPSARAGVANGAAAEGPSTGPDKTPEASLREAAAAAAKEREARADDGAKPVEQPATAAEAPLEIVPDAESEPVVFRDDSAAAIAAEVEKNARKLSLLELNERTCKWPIGDPSTNDFYFCGLRCAPDKPYCEAHAALAYQPMSSRRDRERARSRTRAVSA